MKSCLMELQPLIKITRSVLLEFIDYYETYKDSKNEYFQLLNNRLTAIESLNLAAGTTLIK